jgi:hypothetical protein
MINGKTLVNISEYKVEKLFQNEKQNIKDEN